MMVPDDEPKKKKKKVKKPDPYACKHGKKRMNFPVPYQEVCKRRYHDSVVRYNEQFKHELEAIERMQPTAYEQIRFHRLFAITTLWPPLHTRKEVDYTINVLYKLNKKVAQRVDEIMSQKF